MKWDGQGAWTRIERTGPKTPPRRGHRSREPRDPRGESSQQRTPPRPRPAGSRRRGRRAGCSGCRTSWREVACDRHPHAGAAVVRRGTSRRRVEAPPRRRAVGLAVRRRRRAVAAGVPGPGRGHRAGRPRPTACSTATRSRGFGEILHYNVLPVGQMALMGGLGALVVAVVTAPALLAMALTSLEITGRLAAGDGAAAAGRWYWPFLRLFIAGRGRRPAGRRPGRRASPAWRSARSAESAGRQDAWPPDR